MATMTVAGGFTKKVKQKIVRPLRESHAQTVGSLRQLHLNIEISTELKIGYMHGKRLK